MDQFPQFIRELREGTMSLLWLTQWHLFLIFGLVVLFRWMTYVNKTTK